jgi:hypothetical protein
MWKDAVIGAIFVAVLCAGVTYYGTTRLAIDSYGWQENPF